MGLNRGQGCMNNSVKVLKDAASSRESVDCDGNSPADLNKSPRNILGSSLDWMASSLIELLFRRFWNANTCPR